MTLEVSTFMDGAADEPAARAAMNALKNETSLRRTWDTYQLIGDVLRQSPAMSPEFTTRVIAQLASEPTVLAPVLRRASAAKRLIVPLAASLMGVGAVAWVAQSLDSPQPGRGMVTASPDNTSQTTFAAVQVADKTGEVVEVLPHGAPHFREYVLVHQGYSPRTNMQGVAHYSRSVSEQRQGTSK